MRYASMPPSFWLARGLGSSRSAVSACPSRSTSAGANRSRSRRARVATSTRYAATRPEVPHHRLEGLRALPAAFAAFLRTERFERIIEVLELVEQRVVLLHGKKNGAGLTALC